MAEGGGAATASRQSDAAFDEAHRRLLADDSIQFDLAPFQPLEPPSWLRWLGEFLIQMLPVLKVLFWIGAGALVLFLVYSVAVRLRGSDWPWRRRRSDPEPEDWRPEEAPARALLSQADALAADGHYAEAAHLLLVRSIEDIEARRPKLVRPALTSRDIASAPQLPAEPRSAFAEIVRVVEQSLFGGRAVERSDWDACRSAYQRFAFAEGWR